MFTLTPQQFVANWSNTQLKESASYITHFDDLCELVGHAKPAHADKTGATFTYQKGTLKSDGGQIIGQGFADVWFKDHFAIEYKGAGRHQTLTEALKQLRGYAGSLENPPLLVVCDIEHYEVHTNFNGAVTKTYTFTNADIATSRDVPGTRFTALQILQRLFHHPEALRPQRTITDVTEDAARQFANLSESIHRKNPQLDTRPVARFLVKMMFCLFCEDVGLLPPHLFGRIVEKTMDSKTKFTRSLRDLFQAMATGGDMWGEDIPHFDGGLFQHDDADQDVIDLDGADARAVLKAAGDNWADIDPTIFGSLFQRALDIEGRRAELGAHYTSRRDIETLVEPVLMRPLRADWGEIKLSAAKLAARHAARRADGNSAVWTPAFAGVTRAAIKKLIAPFLDRLAALKVLDPACGSGNFLYVCLTLLKDLEQEVIAFAAHLGLTEFEPRVSPAQLYGLEKDDFAHELASIVVWIGFLQWKLKNGYDPAGETPILKPLNNIQHVDAIIDLSGFQKPDRSAREPVWPAVDVIVGNPPFLGGNRVRGELGNEYVEALFELYKGRVPAFSDLCCYWFEKARAMIAEGKVKRVGLLATNSIRGGANREVLKRIKETGGIFWAISDRDWLLDGAAVNVSMIGFDNGTESIHTLNDQIVETINPDLTSQLNLTQAKILSENQGVCFIGTKKAGAFDIDSQFAAYLLNTPNPHRKPNSDVVFPWLNGKMIAGREPERWIISFGEMTLHEASLYEKPFEYVRANIYPERQKNNEERARVKWWQHRRPATDMREAVAKMNRYIATPRVSKYRLFVWIQSHIVPDDGLYIFARDDDYFFGILHSRVHEMWALRQGTSLEDRPRYTPTTTFETFPFPWPPGQEDQSEARVIAIAQAAKELNELRENWLNPYPDQPAPLDVTLKKRTLTNLYNAHSTWLQLAHRKLDDAVLDAYGWPRDLGDDNILARLLALNLQRAAA